MTRDEFARYVRSRIVLLDGATGTELANRGLPAGVSPELWVAEHPESIRAVQDAYRQSGSQLVYSPTFGGNRVKLGEYGLQDRVFELNQTLAQAAKSAAGNSLVFGDISSTGRFLSPVGDLDFEEAVSIFREQAEALKAGGVDGFAIETMMDLGEARAALLGVREAAPDMPVIVTLTFEKSGRTLTGCEGCAALIALQSLGADAFGCNCSTGPDDMAKIIAQLKPYAKIPLVAKPNAGLPRLEDGKTVFSMSPEVFARHIPDLVQAGASLVGGCCGTTPEYIRQTAQSIASLPVPEVKAKWTGMVASSRTIRRLAPDEPFAVIGERINPTGKKALQQSLREGSCDLVLEYAAEQTVAGASLLDVNVGVSGIDEVQMMRLALEKTTQASDLPICIDSTRPEVVELALRRYGGRALLNSISSEKGRLEKILPLAAKYGAMVILLPLTDAGIPADGAERIAVIRQLLQELARYGIGKEDVCVDALILTASTGSSAAASALEVLDFCRSEGLNSVCGLSNISYGLPARSKVNLAFLGMAVGRGLNMAIANPMCEELMDLIAASDLLAGRDRKMEAFLARFGHAASASSCKTESTITPEESLHAAILKGDDEGIVKRIDAARKAGCSDEAIQRQLIGAIQEVGARFERKEYFLPQLIMSADAMRKGMTYLQKTGSAAPTAQAKEKIILATVKGDIHDIGKNIVGVMLRNYGYEVIDLGKDVPAEVILDAAEKEQVRLIGLSALMTTTMHAMKEVTELAKARGLSHLKFIVGGAVVDSLFADSIGAKYASDAMDTVSLADEK